MDKVKREELRRIAGEATPGPWTVRKNVGLIGVEADNVRTPAGREIASSHNRTPNIAPKEAAYIAAFNPKVAIELLDHIDWLDADGLHTCHENCRNHVCTLRRERDALRTEVETLKAEKEERNKWIGAQAGILENAVTKLEIFQNRRKLAYSLREESSHVYAFVEAIAVETEKVPFKLSSTKKENSNDLS